MADCKIVLLRLDNGRADGRTAACLIGLSPGTVFLVGKYWNGLKLDSWYTWRIFQDVVRRQLSISGSRVPIALYLEESGDGAEKAELREVKSMPDLVTHSEGTVIRVLVTVGKDASVPTRMAQSTSVAESKPSGSRSLSLQNIDVQSGVSPSRRGIEGSKRAHTSGPPPAQALPTISRSRSMQLTAAAAESRFPSRRAARFSADNRNTKEEQRARTEQAGSTEEPLMRTRVSLPELIAAMEMEEAKSRSGRILNGRPLSMANLSHESTSPRHQRDPPREAEVFAVDRNEPAQVQTRDFVTVNYCSSKGILRRRSFREKKVRRRSVVGEVTDILSVLNKSVPSGTLADPVSTPTPTRSDVSIIQHPDAPSGLTTKQHSTDIVKLLWDPVSVNQDGRNNGHRVIGYTVYINGQTEALVEGVGNCTLELLELQPNRPLDITVRTRCAHDVESLPSESLWYTAGLAKEVQSIISVNSRPESVQKVNAEHGFISTTNSTPADHLSPSSPHSVDLMCDGPSLSGRTSRSSSSGIGTDTCPSPNPDRLSSLSSPSRRLPDQDGWMDEPLSEMHRYFLKSNLVQPTPFTLANGEKAKRTIFRKLPSFRRRQRSASGNSAKSDLDWDPCFDAVSENDSVKGVIRIPLPAVTSV